MHEKRGNAKKSHALYWKEKVFSRPKHYETLVADPELIFYGNRIRGVFLVIVGRVERVTSCMLAAPKCEGKHWVLVAFHDYFSVRTSLLSRVHA